MTNEILQNCISLPGNGPEKTDWHTHAFHPKIAGKVLKQLHGHYGIAPVGTGLAEDLLSRLKRAGLERAVVHTAATTADQVVPANDWAKKLQADHQELMAFGTLHPGFTQWEKELERLEQMGIAGVKFHPDFQGYDLDAPALRPFFEAIGDRFVLMFHIGDRLPPEKNPSSPAKLAKIRKDFPKLKIIAAHLGGYLHWEQALEMLAGTDVFLDTSSSLRFIPDHLLHTLLRRHPKDRILFGSDYPLFDPLEEIKLLKRRARLNEQEIVALMLNGTEMLDAGQQSR
ncbi:MAG TPA: amidohydrolase [Desulfonatronum sp.]|nr:amidohydrolase [Desulfonatronum sp.]